LGKGSMVREEERGQQYVRTHGGVCTSMRMSIDSCQINPNVPPSSHSHGCMKLSTVVVDPS
jgi:hypothetical protein